MYYNVTNIKEFTGMMCEKEKCYSMPFQSLLLENDMSLTSY